MIKNILIFSLGVAAGATGTYFLLKKKILDDFNNERNEEMKKERAQIEKNRKIATVSVSDSNEEDVPDKVVLLNEVETKKNPEKPRLTEYSKMSTIYKKDEDTDLTLPYIIGPDEFGDIEGYDEINLTYYADGVVTDDLDNAVDNVSEILGTDWKDHFGEYEDDSVCVRNDILKADYQILLDLRNWSDIAGDTYKYPTE